MKVEILLITNEKIIFEPDWKDIGLGVNQILDVMDFHDSDFFECEDVHGVAHVIQMAHVVKISEYKEDIQESLTVINGNSEELGYIVVEAINKYHQSFGHTELNI